MQKDVWDEDMQKAYPDNKIASYFQGRPGGIDWNSLPHNGDRLYLLYLLENEYDVLKLVSVANAGKLNILEDYRNATNGLVISLELTKLRFKIISADTPDGFECFGTSITDNGVIEGIIRRKINHKNYDFLFIPHTGSKRYYLLYVPENDSNLTEKYLAGSLNDQLTYLYKNLGWHFHNK